ncbi:hypothetical protein DFJ74DRAFT_645598 [Hyaloraphidium curvatum]|nr:hypothetical protein DFJ74DRAFT_645598 [Hyaloraphidium curvatum]
MATVRDCLVALGATPETWAGAATVADEFSALKRLYFARVLKAHPDKGGDPAAFRTLQEAWESLRALYDGGGVNPAGFGHYWGAGAREAAGPGTGTRAAGERPSWEWYAEAAAEEMPGYKVEPAKSGRSRCQAGKGAVRHDDPGIGKGEVRCGWLDKVSGGYGRWTHLGCWRVPATVWLGLPKPGTPGATPQAFEQALLSMGSVTLTGFAQLDAEQRAEVVAHCSNPDNWAQRGKVMDALGIEKPAKKGKGKPRAAKKAKVEPEPEDEQDEDEAYEEAPKPVPKAKAARGRAKPARGRAKPAPADDAEFEPTPMKQEPTFVKAEFVKTEAFLETETFVKSEPAAPAETAWTASWESTSLVTAPQSHSAALVRTAGFASGSSGGAGTQLVLPRPGVGNAIAGAFAGQTFVLTGIFPEVGGGAGLDLGKGRTRAFIESFGGRVTGSVSGKTTYLVVGKEPGYSKVSQAEGKGVATVDLAALLKAVEEPKHLAVAPAPAIGAWSSGYRGNGLGNLIAGPGYRAQIEYGARAVNEPAPRKKAAPKRKRRAGEDGEDYECARHPLHAMSSTTATPADLSSVHSPTSTVNTLMSSVLTTAKSAGIPATLGLEFRARAKAAKPAARSASSLRTDASAQRGSMSCSSASARAYSSETANISSLVEAAFGDGVRVSLGTGPRDGRGCSR